LKTRDERFYCGAVRFQVGPSGGIDGRGGAGPAQRWVSRCGGSAIHRNLGKTRTRPPPSRAGRLFRGGRDNPFGGPPNSGGKKGKIGRLIEISARCKGHKFFSTRAFFQVWSLSRQLRSMSFGSRGKLEQGLNFGTRLGQVSARSPAPRFAVVEKQRNFQENVGPRRAGFRPGGKLGGSKPGLS